MELALHPDAARRFDELGEELLLKLVVQPAAEKRKRQPTFKPDIYVNGVITPDMVMGDIVIGAVDQSGRPVQRFFQEGNKRVGFEGDSCLAFVKLAEAAQRTSALAPFVSEETVRDCLFVWTKQRCRPGLLPVRRV